MGGALSAGEQEVARGQNAKMDKNAVFCYLFITYTHSYGTVTSYSHKAILAIERMHTANMWSELYHFYKVYLCTK